MNMSATDSIAREQNSVGNPVVRRGYGTYGGEVDKGEVRGTSTPPNDPAQMVGTTSAGSSPHPFGYTGRRWDPDLGLYYYRARWYDPQLGTFLQTDPIWALDYINLYSYVGLEPGNATDPSGMAPDCDGRNADSSGNCWYTLLDTARLSKDGYGTVADGVNLGGAVAASSLTRSVFSRSTPILPVGRSVRASETRIYGNFQRAGPGHAAGSGRDAVAMARSGDYAEVHVNRQLWSVSGGKVLSRLRPDVAGVRPDGKIDIVEILSPGQTPPDLRAKYSRALGDRMGTFDARLPTRGARN
jgi:RHS repeat-associated protein